MGFIRFVIGTAATVVFKSGIFCWSAGICRRRNVRLWGSYYVTELVVNDNIFCHWILRRGSVDFKEICVSFNITAMCQVHSALKLLFYVSKLLGFAPYTLLDNGVLVPSRAAKIYSIFLCICVMASKGDVFALIEMKNTPILFTGLLLIYSSSCVTPLLAVVVSIRSHKKFQKLTQKFISLDSMLHQTFHAQKKQFYTVLAHLAVGFISLGSFIFWNSFYFDNKATTFFDVALKLALITVQCICVFGEFIVVLQYIILVLFTGQHFSQINIKFAELVHLCSQIPSTARVASTVTFRSVSTITSPKPVRRQLRIQMLAVVDVHNKLLDTVQSINSAYSLQILFNVAKVFVHITFSLYFFLVTLFTDSFALYRVHTLFFILWSSLHLILIITCCDYTKRQVSVA